MSTAPPKAPIPAASVILLREREGAAEVFLLRRHRASTFMSNAFVFPGGKVEPGDAGLAEAAIRELFEEAGILLVDEPLPAERRAAWRARLLAGTARFADLLAEEKLTPAVGRLHFWTRWITPSAEPKRFDAHFYLAELPGDQTPQFDDQETVEQVWLRPGEAVERHLTTAFRLPPPQLRTLGELAPFAGIAAMIAAAADRRALDQPIMPRFCQTGGQVLLLLPWDPDYDRLGVGEASPTPPGPPFAGPSRFVLDGMTWRLEWGPSPQAGGDS